MVPRVFREKGNEMGFGNDHYTETDTGWADTITRKAVRKFHNQTPNKRVFLADVDAIDSPIESDGEHRWVTVCDVHGGLVYHDTLDAARNILFFPELWCPVCQENA